jgi:hypothetical protein
MEHALEAIETQLRGDEVTLALDVLKHAKRFHATVSFIADTGLKEAVDIGALFLFLIQIWSSRSQITQCTSTIY